MGFLKSAQAERTQITCQSLIILCAHVQNVVNKLKEIGARSPDDFNWLSQMRFHCTAKKIDINIFDCLVQYAFEYVGNQPRLVTTPLSDRCYRAIFFALKHKFACALTVLRRSRHCFVFIPLGKYFSIEQGPSGIGKTELIKDLSATAATHCNVFNCSDGLDYISLGKFIKGTAACGAWYVTLQSPAL